MNDPVERLEAHQRKTDELKIVLDAIDDIRSMNVTISFKHIKMYLDLMHDNISDEIVKKVVHFVINPLERYSCVEK